MPNPLISKRLSAFRDERQIVNVGALGTVLVITSKARQLNFPLNPDSLITSGGGQVAGLSGRSINQILAKYEVSEQVGTESGRTSRGTPNLAKAYAIFLNDLDSEGLIDFDVIEKWWIECFVAHFNTEPFRLNYDQGRTLVAALRDLMAQALERQRRCPGKTFVGTVLQHLVGAKLALAMPEIDITHNGSSVADSVSDRSGDFIIDDVVIHCTTAPSEELLKKCKANIQSGKRPIILTISKVIGAAESMAESIDIEGRVEVMDALQFVAANLYEMSLFKSAERKIAVDALVIKYNEIVDVHESDASLRISIG